MCCQLERDVSSIPPDPESVWIPSALETVQTPDFAIVSFFPAALVFLALPVSGVLLPALDPGSLQHNKELSVTPARRVLQRANTLDGVYA